MNRHSKSAWDVEDRRSFQLSLAVVYAPLMLMLVAAAVMVA